MHFLGRKLNLIQVFQLIFYDLHEFWESKEIVPLMLNNWVKMYIQFERLGQPRYRLELGEVRTSFKYPFSCSLPIVYCQFGPLLILSA